LFVQGCAQLGFRFEPMFQVATEGLAAFDENLVGPASDLFVGRFALLLIRCW
jgi:hypothetical protein